MQLLCGCYETVVVDPKSNTSPPVCCAAEAVVPKMFPSEAFVNPNLIKMSLYMPSGRSSHSKRPTLPRVKTFLGWVTPVGQSATSKLCFSTSFHVKLPLTYEFTFQSHIAGHALLVSTHLGSNPKSSK